MVVDRRHANLPFVDRAATALGFHTVFGRDVFGQSLGNRGLASVLSAPNRFRCRLFTAFESRAVVMSASRKSMIVSWG